MKIPGQVWRTVIAGLLTLGLLVPVSEAQSRSKSGVPFTTGSSDEIIKFINEQIQTGWADNEITPSPVAEDAEWVRRVHLDILGRIPEPDFVSDFLKDKDPAKRAKLIDNLLDDEGYVRHLTTVWTNLCIGRQTPRRVSRAGMTKFFREVFARNRPWNEVVYDIISAEGHFEENGAVNFLLAQMTMNDEQVQATAKTARLFLGMQVQCTQCHNHPFNEWQQDQFWQFNSFLRQTRKIDHQKPDPQTGRMVDDYSELVFQPYNFPVFYEKRNGVVMTVDPVFNDKRFRVGDFDPDETDLRKEFAKAVTEGDKPYIALAMVNRTWGQFMGYGFTKPVDDMGPHNAASHPELLDRLGTEFVKSGYDVKQLIRWICNSEAYNLTSQITPKNEADNPAAGEVPLFSHMYVKSMEAEQLYDSLIIATNAHKSGRASWDESERQRQQWLQQFVIAFGTDEGDEATTFNGTIPQALMMMNGELIRNAISADKGGFLRETLEGPQKDAQKIQTLYLSTLSRLPNAREMSMSQKLISGSRDKLAAYQDLFWALLNSNEFIFVH